MVHREGVGLCVEHPVFQGEHVIFREQKIEIPVTPGREGSKTELSVLWGTLVNDKPQRPLPWAVLKAAGRFEIPSVLAGLVPGKDLWMLGRGLRFGAIGPGLFFSDPV